MLTSIMAGDGGKTVASHVKNCDVDDRIKPLLDKVLLPTFVHTVSKYLPSNKLVDLLAVTGDKPV